MNGEISRTKNKWEQKIVEKDIVRNIKTYGKYKSTTGEKHIIAIVCKTPKFGEELRGESDPK